MLYVGHCYVQPSKKNKVAKLIGQRCLISCNLNKIRTDVLWDTGAQVSIVSKPWLNEHLPDMNVRLINEIVRWHRHPKGCEWWFDSLHWMG